MKLIVVFMLFSFVIQEEVLSNPVAVSTENPLRKTEDDNEGSSEEVDELVSKLQLLFAEVNDDALQKCVENNDTDALEKAKAADEELSSCVLPIVDNLIDMTLNNESNGMNLLRNVSEHFCKAYPVIQEKCFKDYHSKLQPCLSDTDVKGRIMYDKILHAAAEYLCKYDIEFLIEAFQNGFGCSWLNFMDMAFCSLPSLQELVSYNNSPLTIPRSLAGKGCQLHKDMAQCINMKLSSCKNTTYSEVIIGLFNTTASTLPVCPSARTEWEEHLDQVLGKLFKEEQRQTDFLKLVKQQLDELTAFNAKHMNVYENDKQMRMKENEDILSIFKILSEIKKSQSI